MFTIQTNDGWKKEYPDDYRKTAFRFLREIKAEFTTSEDTITVTNYNREAIHSKTINWLLERKTL